MPCYDLRFTVPRGIDDVWRLAAERFGEVHRWAPGLTEASMDRPPGLGATRTCTLERPLLGRDQIQEEITRWDPPEAIGYRVLDPPGPLTTMGSTWRFEPMPDGTRVSIEIELEAWGRGLLTPLVILAWHLGVKQTAQAGALAFQAQLGNATEAEGSRP